ncbi:MAG: hypothetical protein KAR38_03100 [Calditrichia bacterium]|nr:hypothetical protein [Calditrichia bacterium]
MPKLKTSAFKVTFVLDEEFQHFKDNARSGQIYQAKIINKIDSNHYLLLLNKQKIIAEFSENLPIDTKVILKVSSIARRISLQYLGMVDEAFKKFKKMFPSKYMFTNKQWEVLFTKWVQYNLPLEKNAISIFQQFYNNLNIIDSKLILFIPELWLFAKKWKLTPTKDNIIKILQLFKFNGDFSNPFSNLLNLLNISKNEEQNANSLFSCLLFEKKMPKLNKSGLESLKNLFNSETFLISSRAELISLVLKNEGFLIFPDNEKHWRAVWVKRIKPDKEDVRFHLMIFSLIQSTSMLIDIYLEPDYIRVVFTVSSQNLKEKIEHQLAVFEEKIQAIMNTNVIIGSKLVELPELIFFKRLNKDLQLKRVI